MATPNQNSNKHPGGRPLKFKNKKDLQARIDAYFADCDLHPIQVTRYEWQTKEVVTMVKNKKGEEVEKVTELNDYSKEPNSVTEWKLSEPRPYTITGLANFLETTRETLIDYQGRKEFTDTIKAAKSKIEEYWENHLMGGNVTGVIFNLKNNYNWRDKTEVDEVSDQTITVVTRKSVNNQQPVIKRKSKDDATHD